MITKDDEMNEIRSVVRATFQLRARDISNPPASPSANRTSLLAVVRRPGVAIGLASFAVAVVVATVFLLRDTGDRGRLSALQATRVYGVGTTGPLILAPPDSHAPVRISAADAMRSVKHPFASPDLKKGLVFFGLAKVTASYGLSSEDAAPLPEKSRLAWVGVYRVNTQGDINCPASPTTPNQSLPNTPRNYYFAVIVDAVTGTETTWNEDESSLLERLCSS